MATGGPSGEAGGAEAYGIVVILTVQTKCVEPVAFLGSLGSSLRHDRNRPVDMAGHHNGFQAEHVGLTLQIVNRLLRRMHRNPGSQRHADSILAEDRGMEGVGRSAARPPELFIIHMWKIGAE